MSDMFAVHMALFGRKDMFDRGPVACVLLCNRMECGIGRPTGFAPETRSNPSWEHEKKMPGDMKLVVTG